MSDKKETAWVSYQKDTHGHLTVIGVSDSKEQAIEVVAERLREQAGGLDEWNRQRLWNEHETVGAHKFFDYTIQKFNKNTYYNRYDWG